MVHKIKENLGAQTVMVLCGENPKPRVYFYECGFASNPKDVAGAVASAKNMMKFYRLRRYAILFKCESGYALVWVKPDSQVKHLEKVLVIAKKYPRINLELTNEFPN